MYCIQHSIDGTFFDSAAICTYHKLKWSGFNGTGCRVRYDIAFIDFQLIQFMQITDTMSMWINSLYHSIYQ